MGKGFPMWVVLSLAGVVGLAGAAVLFAFDPAGSAFYPPCLFRRFTGWNCPGCGSLRAMHELLHGNLVEALRFNALLVLSVPLFAGLAVRYWVQTRRGERATIVRPRWIWLYGVAWVAFAIARELPLPLFAAWSP